MISPEYKHNCSEESPEKKESRHKNLQPTCLVNPMKKSVEALPAFDLEAIEKLFDKDLKICEIALANVKETVE